MTRYREGLMRSPDVGIITRMEPSPEGKWVRAEDAIKVEAERDTLKAALEEIANGGPLTGQRTGPMKMYQAMAVARAALAACVPPQEKSSK